MNGSKNLRNSLFYNTLNNYIFVKMNFHDMKKKSILIALACLTFANTSLQAQDDNNLRAITTATPFLVIAADARAAGLADQGVATSADAYAQQWNPAKYVFAEKKQGFGINYTPYLSNLVNDIFLGNVNYYNRLNERSAVAASFRYFSLGEIEFRQGPNDAANIQKPNEFTLDLSYALRMSDHFSMAVAGRYLRSDLRLQARRAGLNISNIGPKIKYDDAGQENFIPTNFRLGAGFDFILDEFNKITPTIEFNKLLVPSPQDFNGNGVLGDAQDVEQYQSISSVGAIFSSWGDADGGFSEELKEITWALGAEYMYQDIFGVRAGYFNESDEKGARKFVSLGLGFKYTILKLDISYLFSASRVRSPLENTLRFGLSFNFGDDFAER